MLIINPILIFAAIIPAIILLVYVYRADRLEKEPTKLLVSLVLRGILATFGALLAEEAGTFLLSLFLEENSTIYNVFMYFIVVACSEEGFKYLLLYRRTWKSPDFNCQFDGVVYAVFVSLGFALWENISYVLQFGLGTAAVRALTAVPGHACFGVFMGTWYGLAKRHADYGNEVQARRCKRLAFIFPAVLHGTYDYIATAENIHFAWAFFVFVGVMFFVAWKMIKHLSRNDKYI